MAYVVGRQIFGDLDSTACETQFEYVSSGLRYLPRQILEHLHEERAEQKLKKDPERMTAPAWSL
jgi:hypothetical protein